MRNMHERLKQLQAEGAEKFAALSVTGNAVRNFADVKRENSADGYDIERISAAVEATVETSVRQSSVVYNMFASSEQSEN